MTDRNNPDRCCTADCCAGRGVSKEPPKVVRVVVGTDRDYEMVRYVPEAALNLANDRFDAACEELFKRSWEIVQLKGDVGRLQAENEQLKAQLAGVGVGFKEQSP